MHECQCQDEGATNVGNEDLPAAGVVAARRPSKAPRVHSAAAATAALETAPVGRGADESRLGLAILRRMSVAAQTDTAGKGRLANLADVDEATHQVLVAERGHSGLGLLPSRVLHNTGTGVMSM